MTVAVAGVGRGLAVGDGVGGAERGDGTGKLGAVVCTNNLRSAEGPY